MPLGRQKHDFLPRSQKSGGNFGGGGIKNQKLKLCIFSFKKAKKISAAFGGGFIQSIFPSKIVILIFKQYFGGERGKKSNF